MGIGERIAEERKRLGLSQAAFAERVGVSFSSQRRYESGTRSPDAEYLTSLEGAGVDMEYVLSGMRDIPETWRAQAGYRVNVLIAMALDLDPGAFGSATEDAYNQSVADKAGEGPPMEAFLADKLDDSLLTVENAVYSAVESSPRILDEKLLGTVVEELEKAIERTGLVIGPAKKARAVLMLYRSFKASGKVDSAMIEEAVRLASS